MQEQFERDFQEIYNQLGEEGQELFSKAIREIIGKDVEIGSELFALKIKLEGENFHA